MNTSTYSTLEPVQSSHEHCHFYLKCNSITRANVRQSVRIKHDTRVRTYFVSRDSKFQKKSVALSTTVLVSSKSKQTKVSCVHLQHSQSRSAALLMLSLE